MLVEAEYGMCMWTGQPRVHTTLISTVTGMDIPMGVGIGIGVRAQNPPPVTA